MGGITINYYIIIIINFTVVNIQYCALSIQNNTLYVNKTTANNQDVTNFLRTIDDSTNDIKGLCKITKTSNTNEYLISSINTVTEHNDYLN